MSLESITNGRTQGAELVNLMRDLRVTRVTPDEDFIGAQRAIGQVIQAYSEFYPALIVIEAIGKSQTPNEVSVTVREALPL